MSDQWYYAIGGESRGPVSKLELKERAQAGELTSSTLVWKEGMTDWVAAGTLGLKSSPPPVKPPLPSGAPLKSAADAKPLEPPAPPAQYMTPPPRPTSRAGTSSGQQSVAAIATGVALVAGLVIGWLAHAMLVPPREKLVAAAPSVPAKAPAAVTPAPAPKIDAAKPALPAAAGLPVAAPATPRPTAPAVTPLPTPEVPPETPVVAESPPSPAAAPSAPLDPPAAPTSAPGSVSTPANSQGTKYVPKITLYQEIDVQRASKMPILETISQSQYQFLSQLDVGLPDAEGIRTVGQTVLDTRLLKADELSQAQLADSLKKLKGWQFSYTLSKDGEVLKMMAGPADAPVAGKVAPKGTEGFIVTSVMDEAGWKELAQISFYVPDEQASGNKRHLRQMTHDFGPLGSFTGETSFVRKGMQRGLLQIDYAHKLTYRAPAKGAAIAGSPITVSGADLRPDIAGGSIWYDQKAKRVRQAEDHFHVKGEIATSIAPLGIEEQQAMTVKLVDVNPWSK